MDDLLIEGGRTSRKGVLWQLSWALICIAPLVACQGPDEQGDIGQLESSLEEADVEFEDETSESGVSVPSALTAPPPSVTPVASQMRRLTQEELMLGQLKRINKEERAYFRGTVTSISERTMPLPDSMLFGYEREVGREFLVRVAEVTVLADYCNVREHTVEVVFRSGKSSFPGLAEGNTYAILGLRQEGPVGAQVLVSSRSYVARQNDAGSLPPLLPALAEEECSR